MKTLVALTLLSLLPLAAHLEAQETTLPPVVPKGFEEFQKNGTLAAMGVWLAGSARDTDDDWDRATAKMESIQNTFGRMLGYEVIRIVVLSPSTQRVYAAVKFEKGVAWMSFDCYKPLKVWIVARFDFGTNANLILPPNILGGK
ncbi:MAG: hypothetical protein QOE70_4162 [Chthoniobacter sp.]|jgi:hypothetical protein|nr:hypothetical protein [Chthoniobacter sp.]